MEKLLSHAKKVIAITSALVIIGCLSIIFGYVFLRKIDNNNCYEHIAQKYGVQPTYQEINNEILKQINESLVPEMKRDQVMDVIEQIAPTRIISEGRGIDVAVKLIVELRICKFYENNLLYIVEFSYDGRLVDIIPYVDD